MSNIVCFGEVLWDVFSDDKKIGGAPLNVALRLHSYKNNVTIISRVGKDDDGDKLKEYIETKGLLLDYVQTDAINKTSRVDVVLDEKGSATYVINYPCAWDFIEYNENLLSLVENSDAFIFGSLVTRNKKSKETLEKLLKKSKFSVFDVNLRPPFYKINELENLMKVSNFLKFNNDELLEISQRLGSKSNIIEDNILFISEYTNTKIICVTRGAEGAILFYNDKFFYNNGYSVKVSDTVGSGDSFLATLIDLLLKKETPQKAINYACAVGALVAENHGANPNLSINDIENLINSKRTL